ncbi:MAG: hypothetical protein KAU14_07320 [Thermoplasmata archaeon]|nr:hypothetical protein [Thermoplasmata archaeon]
MTNFKRGPSEVKDNIIHKSELNISGDVILADNIIYKSKINLHVPDNMMDNGLIRSFLDTIPFSQTPTQTEDHTVWTLPVGSPEMGDRTLVGIKEIIRKEIQTLKAAHRKLLARIAVNGNKKQMLKNEIEKLEAMKPGSIELPHLENVVRLIEQYPVEADLLNEKIENLTDLLHSVTAMQEERRFRKDLGGACGAVEQLLGDAVRIASEAEEIMEELG